MSAENKQILWLNCSKTVAVLAVLVDHTNGVLYTNQDIAYASYFSVSLFIIISGLTSYFSNSSGKKVSGGGGDISRNAKKLYYHIVLQRLSI